MSSRLLVLCVVAFAAMVPSRAASVQAPIGEGYPAVGEPALVTVLASGSEPRRVLRYVIAPSYRTSARMTMGMAISTRAQGEKRPATLPPMLIDFDLGVTDVHADGAITYDMTFTSLDVDGTDADPAAVAAMRTALSALAGLTGSATVTNRGATRVVRFDVERLNDAHVRQTMTQVMSSVDNLSIPLPEEAVGSGARWEARQTMVSDGIRTFQKSVFDLVSLDGPVVTLESRLEQAALPQLMPADGLPPGTKMRLDKVRGAGSGTIVIRLDALVPRSHAEIASSAAMTVISGGRSEPMQVDVRLSLSVAPTR